MIIGILKKKTYKILRKYFLEHDNWKNIFKFMVVYNKSNKKLLFEETTKVIF